VITPSYYRRRVIEAERTPNAKIRCWKGKPVENNSWWPDVSDKNGAEKAIMSGFVAAAFVACVTAAIALVSIFLHKPILGIDGFGLVDATIFAAIGFGIYRKSRSSAVLGLVVYLVERIYMTVTNGASSSAGVMTIILSLAFVHGIRGTFAYRKLSGQASIEHAPLTSGE